MGDMVEGHAAMNRRSKFPTSIVIDRPHEQARKLIWGEINIQDITNEQLQERKIARAIKEYARHTEKKQTKRGTVAQETQKNPEQGCKRQGDNMGG